MTCIHGDLTLSNYKCKPVSWEPNCRTDGGSGFGLGPADQISVPVKKKKRQDTGSWYHFKDHLGETSLFEPEVFGSQPTSCWKR